jgi:hypothetical protein
MDRKPKAKQPGVREHTPASIGQQIVFLFLAATLQWASVLVVYPSLHELIHHDADDEHHDCAVTLFLGGQVDQPALDLITLNKPAFLSIPFDQSYDDRRSCGSFFLRCRPLEHAPPLRS